MNREELIEEAAKAQTQPKPNDDLVLLSDDEREPSWSHPEAVYSPDVFHALRLAVSRQMEPQGEPSNATRYARELLERADAWARPAFPTEASELVDALSTALEGLLETVAEHDSEMHVAHRHIAELTVWKLRREGEPTDAQVRAAWDSLGASVTVHLNFEDLRAALRAAGGVFR